MSHMWRLYSWLLTCNWIFVNNKQRLLLMSLHHFHWLKKPSETAEDILLKNSCPWLCSGCGTRDKRNTKEVTLGWDGVTSGGGFPFGEQHHTKPRDGFLQDGNPRHQLLVLGFVLVDKISDEIEELLLWLRGGGGMIDRWKYLTGKSSIMQRGYPRGECLHAIPIFGARPTVQRQHGKLKKMCLLDTR